MKSKVYVFPNFCLVVSCNILHMGCTHSSIMTLEQDSLPGRLVGGGGGGCLFLLAGLLLPECPVLLLLLLLSHPAGPDLASSVVGIQLQVVSARPTRGAAPCRDRADSEAAVRCPRTGLQQQQLSKALELLLLLQFLLRCHKPPEQK